MPALSRSRFALMATIASIAACSSGDGKDPVSPPTATVTIRISPSTTAVDAGGTVSFSAAVSGTANTGVVWSASGGSISGSGTSITWTAPAGGGEYRVIAKSQEDPSKADTARVTVRAVTVSISPASANVDAGAVIDLTATVSGSANTAVTWTSSGGSITPTGNSSATWTAPVEAGNFTVTATSSANPSQSASASFTVKQIVLEISPSSPVIGFGGSQEFSATISGAADSAVTWSSSAGTFTGTGRVVTWHSPRNSGTYTVTAKSVLNPAVEASAEVTITPIGISISADAGDLFRGESRTYTAVVTGASDEYSGVIWSATCGTGIADGLSFNYTAPLTPGSCTIRAVSSGDTTRSAASTVNIRPEILVSSWEDTDDGSCTYANCTLREAITEANASPDSSIILLASHLLMGGASGTASSRAASARAASSTTASSAVASARAASSAVASARAVSSRRAQPSGGRLPLRDADAGQIEIHLTKALPEITSPIRIIGPGAAMLTIAVDASVGAERRAFTVTQGILTISGVTISGGRAAKGGAVFVTGGSELVLTGVTLRDNHSVNGPGGAIMLESNARASLFDSRLEKNSASGSGGSGGAIAVDNASLEAEDSEILSNDALGGRGGGLSATQGFIRLKNVDFRGNSTAGSGGGAVSIWNGGEMIMQGGAVSGNTTGSNGTILAGASSVSSSAKVALALTGVTIDGNSVARQGGGLQLIRNVDAELDRVTVTNNRVGDPASTGTIGGGILVGPGSEVSIWRSTIAGNTLQGFSTGEYTHGGAGIAIISEGRAEHPDVTIRESTISGNSSAHNGGGIWITDGDLYLVNSTVAGNNAARAGGIGNGGWIDLRNNTIADNTAASSSGGYESFVSPESGDDGHLTRANTILARNKVGAVTVNCKTVSNYVISFGGNITDDGTCPGLFEPGDVSNADPGLAAALADNGGPTRTYALLPGSIAIDGGVNSRCPDEDQRGVPRDGKCDSGSFEYVPAGTGSLRRTAPPPARSRRTGATDDLSPGTGATWLRARVTRPYRQIGLNSSNGWRQLLQTWIALQAVDPNSLSRRVSPEPQ